LQRHAEYFDVNGDHVITVDETRQSLRDLGMGKLASRLLSLAINAGFGFQNAGRPTLTIDIDKIQHTRNRSHSGVFTEDGQFDPAAFTRMFDRFDTNHSGSLSESEIRAMIKANAKDPIGPLASKGEFGMLMAVAADATETVNGKQEKAISRANMAAFYDGSLLYKLAEQHGHPHRAPEA
jgi:Ca2+-binding EF-hand superfamily protein